MSIIGGVVLFSFSATDGKTPFFFCGFLEAQNHFINRIPASYVLGGSTRSKESNHISSHYLTVSSRGNLPDDGYDCYEAL